MRCRQALPARGSCLWIEAGRALCHWAATLLPHIDWYLRRQTLRQITPLRHYMLTPHYCHIRYYDAMPCHYYWYAYFRHYAMLDWDAVLMDIDDTAIYWYLIRRLSLIYYAAMPPHAAAAVTRMLFFFSPLSRFAFINTFAFITLIDTPFLFTLRLTLTLITLTDIDGRCFIDRRYDITADYALIFIYRLLATCHYCHIDITLPLTLYAWCHAPGSCQAATLLLR